MATEEITIPVDSDAAKAFREASPEEQRAFSEWFAVRLKRAREPRRSLDEIMDEIGYEAQRRGLTPEILQSILDEKE